ncbi:MAG TPA: hypothetical protein VFP21_01215 [Solirubrobacterales bacterium]|nr:hypothetical protein [Solirubrobacterales bacterium]
MKEWAQSRVQLPEPLPEGGAAPDVEPETAADAPPDRLIFQSVNRFRRETVQAGQKVLINNQIVVQPHRDIAFNEYFWVPDMQDPDQAEKAQWLKERVERGIYKGEIILVPEAVTVAPVGVRSGPRTSVQVTQRVERPDGPLSVTIPE